LIEIRQSFLDTTSLPVGEPFAPVLRSSLAHRHRQLNAHFEQRDGWLVPTAYPGEESAGPVCVADVSHVGKLEVFSSSEPSDPDILDCLLVGPAHWALLCRYADLAGVWKRVAPTAEFVIDRTSAWCALLLAGTSSDVLLRRISPIAEVPGRGPVGRVPGTIFRRSSGYWLVFSQEFAQYAWDLALDLAAVLGGGPSGVDAVTANDPLLSSRTPVRARA
jgi:hypothetical protein